MCKRISSKINSCFYIRGISFINGPEPVKESLDMSDTCMMPVAYRTHVGSNLNHQNQSHLESWASTKVDQTEENKLIFDKGEAVLSADKPSDFQFDGALVHLQKGAVVLLRQSNGIKRVVNLHDTKRDSVTLKMSVCLAHFSRSSLEYVQEK